MKIYLAMTNDAKKWGWCPRRMLLSYHYFRSIAFAVGKTDLFIDSGAFSAWKLGKPIKLQEYMKFLKQWGDKSTVYASLDVIGSIDQTARNQRIMEAAGLHPLPVYHWGEDYAVLEDMCKRYRYVACSGTATVFGEGRGMVIQRRNHFDRVFKISQKYETLVHGFGVTDIDLLLRFPWYSVDSSSWVRGRRFGSFQLFSPYKGRMMNINVNDPAHAFANRDMLVNYYGVPMRTVVKNRYTMLEYNKLSARSWELLEDYINTRDGNGKGQEAGKSQRSGSTCEAPVRNADRDGGARRPHCRQLQSAQDRSSYA